jgi:hypothetical protein
MNEHTCIRQEDFDKVRQATSDLKGDLRVNTEMTARLELAMTRMAESIQRLSECTIEMKATQVTSEVFNQKFESLEARFREQRDKCVDESIERDEELELAILNNKVQLGVEIQGVKDNVNRHDLYFYIIGAVLLLVLANPLDWLQTIRGIV